MRLVAALAVCLGLLAACERVTHDMARQPRQNPASISPLFTNQQAARPPVPGTVVHARGDLALLSSGRAGLVVETALPALPALATDAQRARGHERYAIYCLPCHGVHGAGDGEVVRRGFPVPPPLGTIALREASDEHLHTAILQGVGVMYPFADRVSSDDAWAVVAYLRLLQREPEKAGPR